jgi:glucose-6-phosphate dehydrogenase assembly protein OpcA
VAHDVIDIEKELKKLWDENKNEKKIKACLFTLIVYSGDSIRGDYIREITRRVTCEYPCRMISIHERSADEDCFTIQVAQNSSLAGGSLIASDQIFITASPGFLERIPYVVVPEIVPDLPVYIIWGADAAKKSAILAELEKYATKIIFDAESSSSSLRDYARAISEKIGKVSYVLQDFHWALSAGWRECLFQAFNKEEGIRFLKSLEQVKITYNAAKSESIPKTDTVARYIQGWLAAELEWRGVNVELVPTVNNTFTSSSILSIEMRSKRGDTYLFIRHPDRDKVILHVTKKESCELPAIYPFPDFQRGFNFIRELFFFVESVQYAKMLGAICSSLK